MENRTTSIRLDDAIREELREAARADDRSVGYVIRRAIREYLDRRKRRNRQVGEA